MCRSCRSRWSTSSRASPPPPGSSPDSSYLPSSSRSASGTPAARSQRHGAHGRRHAAPRSTHLVTRISRHVFHSSRLTTAPRCKKILDLIAVLSICDCPQLSRRYLPTLTQHAHAHTPLHSSHIRHLWSQTASNIVICNKNQDIAFL